MSTPVAESICPGVESFGAGPHTCYDQQNVMEVTPGNFWALRGL